jgi:hypothetical protein
MIFLSLTGNKFLFIRHSPLKHKYMCQSDFSKGNVQFAYSVSSYILCTSQNKYEEIAFVMDMLCVFFIFAIFNVTHLSSYILWFEPRCSHVGFVVDKVVLGQVSSEYFGFPCQSSFHQFLHSDLSSGAGTIGL